MFLLKDKVSRLKDRPQVGEVVEICEQTQRCRVQWPGDPISSYNADRPKRTWVKWTALRKAD
jgi:hypothetical protein